MALIVTTPGAGPLPRHRGEGGGEVGPHHVHRLHHPHGQDRTIVVCCCIKCCPCIDSFKKLPSVKKYFTSDPEIFQLYGGGCVFIVLISQLLSSLMAGVGVQLTLCQWMVLVAAGLTPLTWMGTPKVSKHIYLSISIYI